MADHGTATRYANERCRCDACRIAHNAAVRAQRLRRVATFDPADPRIVHGRVSTYNIGCRCPECKAVNSQKKRRVTTRATLRSGFTLAQLADKRLGPCDCCGNVPRTPLVVDHDHVTGEFRGMLCQGCNTGIGKLGDSVEGLGKAIAYLRRAGG